MVKERLFLLDDVIGSTTTHEFYGWPPTCSPLVVIALFLLTPRSQPQARDWPAHWHVWVRLVETLINEVSQGQLVPIWQGVAQTTSWLRSLTTCSQQMADLSVEKSIY